jgi:3-dehydroquinate dehydratase/shikimate dehydrogenase
MLGRARGAAYAHRASPAADGSALSGASPLSSLRPAAPPHRRAARAPPPPPPRAAAASGPAAMAAAPAPGAAPPAAPPARANTCLLCTSLTASTVAGMVAEAAEAAAAGADLVELRLDFLSALAPERDLPVLLAGVKLPAIVTFRPTWEGGKYAGGEAPRLATLKYAAALGAAFVDVEFKAAAVFFAAYSGEARAASPTRVILSSHDYARTPPDAALEELISSMRGAGADIVKFATTAADAADALRVLRVLRAAAPAGPVIALAMGERGVATRILAPKYGGFLTFGALSPERASAPGQPALGELRSLYRLGAQSAATRVYGVIGNPVAHSRSPALHNAALAAAGADAVYLPLLVDDLPSFLAAAAAPDLAADWAGFSVTLPHKEAALAAADAADAVAARIGAANTLVRRPDGGLDASNTDWAAAIGAIERGLGGSGREEDAGASPLRGLTVVVVGAGGAGRALAFGAAARGAAVVVANRALDRAEALAAALGGGARATPLADLAAGAVRGDVLANTTSVGMHPAVDATPVPAAALAGFRLVFDAVYTPRRTRLLREAAAAGCATVTGDEMFVGQAAAQFRAFTGLEPPLALMRRTVLAALGEPAEEES